MVNLPTTAIQKTPDQRKSFYQKITLIAIHLFVFSLTAFSLCSCHKNEDPASRPYPRVRTISIEETVQGTIFTGEIFYAENYAITDHGFVWNTVRDALIHTPQSYEKSLGVKSGKGIFSILITENLTKNTSYSLQAYANNGQYKVYGTVIKFTTKK